MDPLKGIKLDQPLRGFFERLQVRVNSSATKVPTATVNNVFVVGPGGDLQDSGIPIPSTGNFVDRDYVGERFLTDSPLPEAGEEEGSRHGSFRIGLLTEDDYAYFDENGKIIFYGIAGLQFISPLNMGTTPTMFAVLDTNGNLKYRTPVQLAADISSFINMDIEAAKAEVEQWAAERFITETELPETGMEEGARYGSYRIGLLTEGDYVFFEENGTMAFYGAAGIKIDHISEKTPAHGVVVDGVTLKDGNVTAGVFLSDNFHNSTGTESLVWVPGDSWWEFSDDLRIAGTAIVDGLTIGTGGAGVDYFLTFNGETNDGILTWMEDEDYFKFDDGILIPAGEQIYFRDTAIAVQSTDDGWLNLVADIGVEVNAPIMNVSELYSVGEIGCAEVQYWASATNIADDGHVDLPTITANYSGHGFIQVSSAGTIVESAEFEIDSTGTAQIIRGTANVVVNANTDGKMCIGTAAAQNPMVIKDRLGAGTRYHMITFWYH